MATFVDNQQISHLQTNPSALEYVTLTGTVSRSGNTVTLSGLNCHVEITYATSVYGEHNEYYITGSQYDTTKLSTTGVKEYNYSISYDQRPKKFDFSMPNMTVNVGTSDTSKTLWLRCTSNEDRQISFIISFPAGGTSPSGLTVTWNSHTYNSINITSAITSWGSGYSSGSCNLEQIICSSSATASNWTTLARSIRSNITTSTSSTQDVTNSTITRKLDGGVTVKGCLAYKVAAWASTDIGNAGSGAFDNTVRYLPPAPLQPLNQSQVSSTTNNNVTHTITIIGGNSDNNVNASVTTEYRYSTTGGLIYSSWEQVGTAGTPWTPRTATFTSSFGASIRVQARQLYQGQYSDVATLSYTANSADAPDTPTITNVQPQQYGIKANVTIASYGTPSDNPDRYIELEGGVSGGSSLLWRYDLKKAVLTGSFEVNNESGGSIPIFEPNSNYSYRGMATNTVVKSYSPWVNFTCLPPTPSSCSLEITGTTTATITIVCPSMGYGSTVTAYYKLNSGSWVSAGEITENETITANITGLTAGTSYTPTVKFTNVSGDSPSITGTAATTWKAPATPVVSNVSPGKDSLTATVTIANYGVPSDAADRHIELEVGPANGSTSYRYANQTAVLTKAFTVDNNSSATSGAPTLTPNTKYAYRGVARNTKVNVSSSWVQFITKPDAPTATATAVNPFGATFRISAPAQGTAATLTAYYKVGSGSWVSAGTIAQGGYVDVNLTNLSPETTYSITTKITNSTGDSATSSLSITTPGAYKFYGSVQELSERTIKMYGSVNGSSKEAVKLYGSTNGVTKRIF